MADWKELGSNIIKLEGFGVYVTLIDDKLYECPMEGVSGHPRLDQDKCIDWEETLDPPNQEFLNLINKRFELKLTLNLFNKRMSISDVKKYVKGQKEIEKDGENNGSTKDPS